MNHRITFILTFLCTFHFFLAASQANDSTPPNILFILVDDMGWGDLGVFYQNDKQQDKRLHTPELDRLAGEGIQMRRHYCPAPVCAPSRASLLRGVHQGHAGVRNNQFDKGLSNNHTLGTVLQAAGYKTCMIGKYGLQGLGENRPEDWSAYPTKRGFDEFFGMVRHIDGHQHYPANKWPLGNNKNHRSPRQVWYDNKEISADLDKCYTTDLFTAFAKKWIVNHREKQPDQPFFIYLAYDTPHAALQLPTQAYPAGRGLDGGMQWLNTPGHEISTASGEIDSWVHPDYRNEGWSDVEQRFATMVRRIDTCIGDLIQLLRDLKIDRKTLVVFTSDNGPHCEAYLKGVSYRPTSFQSYGPYSGIKRDLWEGGIREPTFAWWPGRIEAGQIDHSPSQFHDWMATFAELAAVPVPAAVDGVSLVPTLTGVGHQKPSQVYVEYQVGGATPNYADFPENRRNRPRQQMQAILLDGYKGVRVNVKDHQEPFEIYDVEQDPLETKNLADTTDYFRKLQQRMHDRVLRIRRPDASNPRPYDKELVPSVDVAHPQQGVHWAAYPGNFPWVPRLDTRPDREGTTEKIDIQSIGLQGNGAVVFTGFIEAPQDGEYQFSITSDTPAVLRIHKSTVLDADYAYQPQKNVTAKIRLQAGYHPFQLTTLYRNSTPPQWNLQWSGPKIKKSAIASDRLVQPE